MGSVEVDSDARINICPPDGQKISVSTDKDDNSRYTARFETASDADIACIRPESEKDAKSLNKGKNNPEHQICAIFYVLIT